MFVIHQIQTGGMFVEGIMTWLLNVISEEGSGGGLRIVVKVCCIILRYLVVTATEG